MDTSRVIFRLSYLLGVKPWDSGVSPPELVRWVEGPEALAPGRALDIGCGTGTNVRYLIEHGWMVTGVDFIARPIKEARRKAPGSILLVGDVTRLGELGVSGPFELMLDLGCFHAIPNHRRDAYVREVASVAAPGAMFLLFAFGQKGAGAPGAPEAEIRERFGGDFDVTEVTAGHMFRSQTWYRMMRKSV